MVQPVRSLPAPRYPQRALVVVDVEKIQARQHQVLAAMEGRPAQPRKSRLADECDTYVLIISAGPCGWTIATPYGLFYFLCYLDTQGKCTKMVHGASCPGVGRAGGDACREGSLRARRYAARVPPEKICLLATNGNAKTRTRGGMGPRPPRRQPVFEFILVDSSAA